MNKIKTILNERNKEYGNFADNSYISQSFKKVQRENQKRMLTNMQQEALDMIFHKIARIINGNPNNKDSWLDIAGYATLVADGIEDESTDNNYQVIKQKDYK